MIKREQEKMITREVGRIITGGYGNYQEVRTRIMNQIRDLVRHIDKELPFDQPEEKQEKKKFDKMYSDKKLPRIIEKLVQEGRLTEVQQSWLRQALDIAGVARSVENRYKLPMEMFVSAESVWTMFLSHIPGIAEVLAAQLIANMPCWRYEKVSSLWRHLGLHLVCPVCTEERKIRDKSNKTFAVLANSEGLCPKCGRQGIAPKRKTGRNIDYASRLRTLAWKIGDCLIKQKSPKYYDIYVEEKKHQLARTFKHGELKEIYAPMYREGKNPYEKDTKLKKGHAHARAMRKMIKIFLQHYWIVSRTIEGLSTREPYVHDKLGHTDMITWQDVLRANGQEPPENLVA